MDPDADPDQTYQPDPDPDPDPNFKNKAQTLKMLKQAHIPYILARHLQIDADPDADLQHFNLST